MLATTVKTLRRNRFRDWVSNRRLIESTNLNLVDERHTSGKREGSCCCLIQQQQQQQQQRTMPVERVLPKRPPGRLWCGALSYWSPSFGQPCRGIHWLLATNSFSLGRHRYQSWALLFYQRPPTVRSRSGSTPVLGRLHFSLHFADPKSIDDQFQPSCVRLLCQLKFRTDDDERVTGSNSHNNAPISEEADRSIPVCPHPSCQIEQQIIITDFRKWLSRQCLHSRMYG